VSEGDRETSRIKRPWLARGFCGVGGWGGGEVDFKIYLLPTNHLAKGWMVRAQNPVVEEETFLFDGCRYFSGE